MLHHHVEIDDLRTHHFRVTLTVPDPGPEVLLSLPVWIPGSYLVREFARHWSGVTARQGRRTLAVEALDKATWRVRCRADGRAPPLVVQARVYAFDTSVRAAFLDDWRGFFNGTSLLLRVPGREHQPQRLTLGRLPAGWEVATAMPPAPPGLPGGGWLAADYDELVDHPVELGSFWRGRFQAGGVTHELVVSGAWPRFDGDRLLDDTRRICQQQIAMWHPAAPGLAPQAPPFGRYLFLLQATDDGWGGLEHRASTALIAPRRDLPTPGMDPASDGYASLLGLISHEYFHAWNVKRLRPAELARIDYTRENHTPLLWFFEGFTSYYDDLMLRRAGLIDETRYLKLLAKTINAVAATPGQQRQSLAEASFDAWIKYYRPDENTPNATVSYYQKGALLALLLDLRLRALGRTLDGLMRALWQRSAGGPVGEDDILAELRQLVGSRDGQVLADELTGWVHSRQPLPLDSAWATVGLGTRAEAQAWPATLGLRLAEGAVTGVQVKTVLDGSAAARAGVQAGDELLAVDGWRIRRLDDARAWVAPGQPFDLLLTRRQRVLTCRVVPDAQSPWAQQTVLEPAARPARAALARRRAWLGG